MNNEMMVFSVMVGSFLVLNIVFKISVSLSMVISAITGGLIGGYGIPIRHLVEGTFGFLDTCLVITTAMIFMVSLEKSGALELLTDLIIKKFHKYPVFMLVLMMFIIMLPGMITGSSTSSVLSAGSIVAPALIVFGISKEKVGAILSLGAVLGMAAPPVSIPAMLIASGVDMPYVGFELPLFLLVITAAIFSVLYLGLPTLNRDKIDLVVEDLKKKNQQVNISVYLPIIVVLLLTLADRLLRISIPKLGMPLIFIIGSTISIFTGLKYNAFEAFSEAVNISIPVLGKLMGVGMFIQIMTLTGVRGLIVVTAISLNIYLLYLAIITIMPAFGSVSSYGAASVLGVPFMFALMSGHQVIIAASLAYICCFGDLMPPTALAGNYAANIVEVPYKRVLKKLVIPVIVSAIIGIAVIIISYN